MQDIKFRKRMILKICDTEYSTAEEFKAAMSGIYLIYEVNKPVIESAKPYPDVQIIDDFGTEEYVDSAYAAGERDVAIPVGHETRYFVNLRDKLQHLPDLASADGYYLIQQENNNMRLVIFRIPRAPSEDGSYTLKATVTNGSVIYTWEAES